VTATPTALAEAREQFLKLVEDVRPELHRYCARLTGSVIEGEDIVQDALARGFYALSLATELPPLRPWLFRIAHNAALDHLKSHGTKLTEAHADLEEVAGLDDAPDPAVVRTALGRFLSLPVSQRSAVILKDVLGHSLEEAAETMGATVMAVKAALVRGRASLRQPDPEEAPLASADRAVLDRYARLFNARDWDGVRALVGNDCRLDLVSKSHRRGKAVGMYFDRYEKADVAVRLARIDGRPALAAYVGSTGTDGGARRPDYFILLEVREGRISAIRDFRYVPYIAAEADLAPLD
jgi:RNA polymerase sigma-70 factor (ECF subfamily)